MFFSKGSAIHISSRPTFFPFHFIQWNKGCWESSCACWALHKKSTNTIVLTYYWRISVGWHLLLLQCVSCQQSNIQVTLNDMFTCEMNSICFPHESRGVENKIHLTFGVNLSFTLLLFNYSFLNFFCCASLTTVRTLNSCVLTESRLMVEY